MFTGKTRTKDKYRVVYTDQQRVELEKEFLFNKYITIRRKTEMATYLGLSERQVYIKTRCNYNQTSFSKIIYPYSVEIVPSRAMNKITGAPLCLKKVESIKKIIKTCNFRTSTHVRIV